MEVVLEIVFVTMVLEDVVAVVMEALLEVEDTDELVVGELELVKVDVVDIPPTAEIVD